MMDEENKSLNTEDTDSKLQDCPLSIEDWIILLNSEINNEERVKNIENIVPFITFAVPLVFSIMAIMLAVEPMMVMFPPKQAPKRSAHQSTEYAGDSDDDMWNDGVWGHGRKILV